MARWDKPTVALPRPYLHAIRAWPLASADKKHIAQVAEALKDSGREVWLLTQVDRVPTWKTELSNEQKIEIRRVVVTSVAQGLNKWPLGFGQQFLPVLLTPI